MIKEIGKEAVYLAAIVHSCGDAIVGHDPSGTITVWNRAAGQLFGYSASEVIGCKLASLAIIDEPEVISPHSNGSVYHAVCTHKDETQFTALIAVFPVRDDSGQVLGLARSIRSIGANHDDHTRIHRHLEQSIQQREAELQAEIAERKKAEERFRLVVEAAPNAMIMVGADGKIALVNSQTEKLFGYDREELLGQKIEILVPERYRGPHHSLRAHFFAAPTARAMGSGRDLFGVRKDGAEVPIEIGLNPITTPEGNFVLTSIIDITERKRAQDEIAAAKLEVESRNKDLETMLHVTSHDLREPLRAIRNFSTMLSDSYSAQIDQKGRDLLNRVRIGAERLDRLVQDILNVAKTRRILPPEALIPGRVIVADALRVLSSRIADTHASIHIADDLPSLRVSLAWGSVAVQNLVANALKFKAENAHPDIEICGYVGENDREVGILIRDRGIGVSPRHAERIFELFQRAVGREVEGTGAGLAIVKQIAERHGGRAWVQAREGGGSDFIITFSTRPGREVFQTSVH